MKIQKIFHDLVKSEAYIDLDAFLGSYESFEELPLISRYKKLATLDHDLDSNQVSNILLCTAFYILNTAMLHMESKGLDTKGRFIAISYTDFDFSNRNEPPIPRFFIYPNSTHADFSNKLKLKQKTELSLENKLVQNHFKACGLSPLFKFYESRFFDSACNEDMVRIFATLK